MDVTDPQTRSKMMSKIRSRNTTPELLIRKRLFSMGFRYRINYKKLPGSPDIVFPKYNAVIFIHGCFWHGHDCELFRLPATQPEFWKEKIDKNRERDARQLNELIAKRWRVCIIWECALKGKKQMETIDLKIDAISSWLQSGHIWIEIKK